MNGTASEIVTKEYSFALLRETDGSIDVTVEYTLPACLESFRVTIPTDGNFRRADGFSPDGGQTYEWDGEAVSPSITFEETVDSKSSRLGGYSFVDAGGWAITQKPSVSERWQASRPVKVIEEVETKPDVAASSDGYLVFVGPHEERRVRGAQQTVRLILPDAASVSALDHAVRQTLKHASGDLVIGARSDETLAVAVPAGEMSWGIAGLQSGMSGFWVKDSCAVDTAHTTWIHEYVHTRQALDTSSSTKWLIEGSANYFAALLAYQQRLATYEEYHSVVSTSKDERAVLAEPGRWPSPYTDYKKGSRVLAALDAEVRDRTDGEKSLQSVFWELNRADERITHPKLKDIVASVAGDALRSWLDTYAVSTATPDVPHRPDLFEQYHIVPVRGRQPVCPVCDSVGSGQYCPGCGTDLTQECPHCTLPLAGDESVCGACGSEL